MRESGKWCLQTVVVSKLQTVLRYSAALSKCALACGCLKRASLAVAALRFDVSAAGQIALSVGLRRLQPHPRKVGNTMHSAPDAESIEPNQVTSRDGRTR
jgi:hypothetical protein